MKNSQKIKQMAGLSLLSALVVVLQLVSNYIQIGSVSITLALIPIVVGAIIYGPKGGFILGLILGVIVCVSPSTALFLQFSFVGTVTVCLLKSAVAGLLAGYLFKLLSKKNIVFAIILTSITVPIVNTGLFIVASLTIFLPLIREWANGEGVGTIMFLFVSMIGINFIIEFFVNSILSPVVIRIVEMFGIHKKIGSDVNLKI